MEVSLTTDVIIATVVLYLGHIQKLSSISRHFPPRAGNNNSRPNFQFFISRAGIAITSREAIRRGKKTTPNFAELLFLTKNGQKLYQVIDHYKCSTWLE